MKAHPKTNAEQLAGMKASYRRELSRVSADIIEAMDNDDLCYAAQLWFEQTDLNQRMLWVAELKGGYFTQAEKTKVRGLRP